MCGIDGRRDLVERQLDHLVGYQASRPVRVGNGAGGPLELDVDGGVLESADILRHPDSSMWEAWGELRQYVFRKVMSQVALDRGIRMADELGLPSNADEWRVERDAVDAEIRKRRWSERHQ